MTIDIEAARQFIHTNGRLIDRHRFATLVDGAPVEPLLAALRTGWSRSPSPTAG